MILVTLDDFSGYYSLAQSVNTKPVIQNYIDRLEAQFIKRILGVELGELFIADVQGLDSDSSAIEDRFQVLIDPFSKQVKRGDFGGWSNNIYESKGMKSILLGMIYSEYVSNEQVQHSQGGMINSQVETANAATPAEADRIGEVKWNDSLLSIIAIQWYCGCNQRATYPEYDGMYFRPKYSNLL